MPGQEDTTTATGPVTPAPEGDSGMSRRLVLRGAATAGIAATALAAAGPAMAAARPARSTRPSASPSGHDGAPADTDEPVIARLRDARTGEIDVYRGTSHTRLRDPGLAMLLVRASQ